MTYREAMEYLTPIANNAALPSYREALITAINALEVAERVREKVEELRCSDRDTAQKAMARVDKWIERCQRGMDAAQVRGDWPTVEGCQQKLVELEFIRKRLEEDKANGHIDL